MDEKLQQAESKVVELQGHTLIFTFYGMITTVIIVAPNMKNGSSGYGGAARCHPRDAYSREVGMRQAMRKACGIQSDPWMKMRALFDAFRDWQRVGGYEVKRA